MYKQFKEKKTECEEFLGWKGCIWYYNPETICVLRFKRGGEYVTKRPATELLKACKEIKALKKEGRITKKFKDFWKINGKGLMRCWKAR